jgi:hypothetical protein
MSWEAAKDSILERIANVYLARRQKGETMDQIKDALYRLYSISEPVGFWFGVYNPIPFGNLVLASYAKKMPQEARTLGEITYTIFCREGIFPRPSDGQGPRDAAYEYEAMSEICNSCKTLVIVSQATGKNINSNVADIVKKWTALTDEIAALDTACEKALERMSREPERPEMRAITSSLPPHQGLFGTRWFMPMNEALEVVPYADETISTDDEIRHFGKYHGHAATFCYHFEDDMLTEIFICLNDSSKTAFHRNHSQLCTDFGGMPAPCPSEDKDLISRSDFNGLTIEHSFYNDEHAGLTEFIKFRMAAKPS